MITSYQHVFTGAKRPQQNEATGGIIADEMGLGKSLVILSTISGSFDRAEGFVSAENQLLQVNSGKKIPSKATLVLAPSSRKSLQCTSATLWQGH